MEKNSTHAVFDASRGDDVDSSEILWLPNELQARQTATDMVAKGSKVVWIFELVTIYKRNPVPAVEDRRPTAK